MRSAFVPSHSAHAIGAALVKMPPDQSIPLAGRGFLETTRIAAGDPGLWRDIFLGNHDNLRVALAKLPQQVDHLDEALGKADSRAVEAFLETAAKRRQSYDNRGGRAE